MKGKFRFHLFFLFAYFACAGYSYRICLAQNIEFLSCVKEYNIHDSSESDVQKIILTNNSKDVIKCLFEFPLNEFFDETSLVAFIMRGTDSLKSKPENQLIVLNNIAHLIKSPKHRNFHLLFSTNTSYASVKKYSPLALMSSFYDKQCHDYQRLAAQIAILTPFFQKTDFVTYYIKYHNVLDVKIGDGFVCHDFDPGQPGFRFYSNETQTEFASVADLYKNPQLIKKSQFYTYNGISLCPWISETYYRSLFSKINGQSVYNDLDKVFGFVPQWHIPAASELSFIDPDTSLAGKFGALVKINRHEKHVKKAFKYFHNSNIKNIQKKRKLVNKNIALFLKEKYLFDFDIDYYYLMETGLLTESDSTTIITTAQNYIVSIDITTGDDTLHFPSDLLIPLPLKNAKVHKGYIKIIESEFSEKGWEDVVYHIYDSLSKDLYNFSPPIITSDDKRKAPGINASSIIYGPSGGYIAPNSQVTLDYYYNPYFYAFHNKSFFIHYKTDCTNEFKIKLQ